MQVKTETTGCGGEIGAYLVKFNNEVCGGRLLQHVRRIVRNALIGSLMCGASLSALAQEISTETSQPVTTSTSNDGEAGDVTITEDGSIVFESVQDVTAITVDSSNNVTVDGGVQFTDSDNTTGILIESGHSGDVVIGGYVYLTETYTREDDDGDDDLDGPVAEGEGRTALLLEEGGVHTGDITVDATGYISVEGNNSAGLLLESQLDGDILLDGGVAVVGAQSVGLAVDDVSGDILVSGGVSVVGENSQAVVVNGDVGGALAIESAISATGFTSTTATNYIAPIYVDEDTDPVEARLDEDDLYDNGSALVVNGSLAQGLLINGNVGQGDDVDDDDDEVKDLVEEFDENRSVGYLYAYGSAPALAITPGDGRTSDIVLGSVVETVRDTLDDDEDEDYTETLAEFSFDQGLINRGAISSDGRNIGFDATGLKIAGSSDGLYDVVVENGFLNSGGVYATAYEANATAVDLDAGAKLGRLENEGTIQARVFSENENSAIALDIGAGADVETITNTGIIRANIVGDEGKAIAVLDSAGDLSTFVNQGSIHAYATDDDNDNVEDEDTHPEFVGETIAIDASSHGADSGLTVVQSGSIASITGDVLFGAGDDVFDIQSGSVSGDTDFGVGHADMSINNAFYDGVITFGGETANLSITGADVSGVIDLSGALAQVHFLDNSVFEGRLIADAPLSDLVVSGSKLTLLDDVNVHLESLTISDNSTLGVSIASDQDATTPIFDVAGAAVLGSDTVIAPQLTSVLPEGTSKLIIESGNLSFDSAELDVSSSDLSWMYMAELEADDTSLALNFRRKTASELGFGENQASAYDAIVEVASSETDFGEALLSISSEDEFNTAYDQLLPFRSDGATRYLDSQSSAVFSSLSDRFALQRLGGDYEGGYWAQQHLGALDVETSELTPGYSGRGLGVTIGYDTPLFGLDSVGLLGTMSDGKYEENDDALRTVSATSYGIGVFAFESLGPLDVQAAAQIADVNFDSERHIYVSDFDATAEGSWGGMSRAASFLVSSGLEMGQAEVRPYMGFDYFALEQDAYTETIDNGVALSLGDAETDKMSASAGLAFAYKWGDTVRRSKYGLGNGSRGAGGIDWLAEIDLGYRDTLSSTPYERLVQFDGYSTSFTVSSDEAFGESFVAGVSVIGAGDLASIRFGLGAETSDEAAIYHGAATVRFKF